jgi:hypothetical protein
MATKSKEQKIVELSDKIATLKGIGETDRAAELEAELAQLTGKAAAPAELPPAEESAATDEFVLPVTADEYEKSSSKFAAVGKHLSEAGAIYWKTQGQTIGIPFTIIEDGPDHGKTGEFFCSVLPKGVWKTKQILEAMGVNVGTKNVNGVKRPVFDANEIPGKQFYSVWTEQVDTRSPEEGGKGSKYNKATDAVGLGASEGSVL